MTKLEEALKLWQMCGFDVPSEPEVANIVQFYELARAPQAGWVRVDNEDDRGAVEALIALRRTQRQFYAKRAAAPSPTGTE